MTKDLKPLRIINGNGPAEQGLQELTRRLGLMEKHGIDATYVNEPDGRRGLASLIEGRGDVCLQIGFGPGLAAIEQGVPLKVLAGANLRAVHVVFASDPAIARVKDLEGRKVGIGSKGALTHQLLTAIMLKCGGNPHKVSWVKTGNSYDVFRAVCARQVDAGLGEVDNMHQQDEFGVHALPDGSLWDQLPEFTNQASYTTVEAIDAKRDLIVGALAASAELYRYICGEGDRQTFIEARLAAMPGSDPGEAEAQWAFYQERRPYALNLKIGPDRLDYMQELNRTMGLQGKVLPYSEVADMSLAEEALARIGGEVPAA